MKIAIFGISGYMGHILCKEATNRGHQVTGFAPNATAYSDYGVEMDLYDIGGQEYDKLMKILPGHDVALSVFPPDVKDYESFGDDNKNLIRACKDSGVRELIKMMGGSAGNDRWNPDRDPFDYLRYGQQVSVQEYYHNIRKGRIAAYDPETELHWVIFTPNHLIKYYERTGKYGYLIGGGHITYDEHSRLHTAAGVISYLDFAAAMLDEAENPRSEFKHQLVSLAWEKDFADEITKKIPVMVNK